MVLGRMKKHIILFCASLIMVTHGRYYCTRRAGKFFQTVQPSTARPSPLVLALFYDSCLGQEHSCCKQALKRQCCIAESVAKALPTIDVIAADSSADDIRQIARKAGIGVQPTFVLYQDGELYKTGTGTPRLVAHNFDRCKQSCANNKRRQNCNLSGVVSEADIIEFVNNNWREEIDKRIDAQVQADAELDRIAASRPVIWGAPYGWWGCGGWWGGPCGWWW